MQCADWLYLHLPFFYAPIIPFRNHAVNGISVNYADYIGLVGESADEDIVTVEFLRYVVEGKRMGFPREMKEQYPLAVVPFEFCEGRCVLYANLGRIVCRELVRRIDTVETATVDFNGLVHVGFPFLFSFMQSNALSASFILATSSCKFAFFGALVCTIAIG